MPTGLAVAIPEGHAGFIQPRSGLALRHGVTCLNTPGLIDSGYRGELKVLLVNTDPDRGVRPCRGASASPSWWSRRCRARRARGGRRLRPPGRLAPRRRRVRPHRSLRTRSRRRRSSGGAGDPPRAGVDAVDATATAGSAPRSDRGRRGRGHRRSGPGSRRMSMATGGRSPWESRVTTMAGSPAPGSVRALDRSIRSVHRRRRRHQEQDQRLVDGQAEVLHRRRREPQSDGVGADRHPDDPRVAGVGRDPELRRGRPSSTGRGHGRHGASIALAVGPRRVLGRVLREPPDLVGALSVRSPR